MLDTSARLLRLLALLQSRRDWRGADLAARIEVNARTLRRDVDRLRSLGYPVLASAGPAGGYRLGAGTALPPLLLEDDEALSVALGLRMAATGTVTGMEEIALRALAKLDQVLPTRLRRRVHALHGAVAPMPMAGPRVRADALTTIAAACRDHYRLTFRYTRKDDRTRERNIEPQGLVCTGARWYLVAWDLLRDDWRTFRVDRIGPRIATGARFVPRRGPEEDLAAYVSRSVSIQPCALRVRVLLHAPLAHMRERIPPMAGRLEPVDDATCRFEAGAPSLDTMAAHLVLLDVPFEVESPPQLADALRALGQRLLQGAHAATSEVFNARV